MARHTLTIFTIGHSTHPLEEFIEMLKAHGIKMVVDVRTIAKSRHNPQFNEVALEKSLAEVNIKYQRLEALGGLRHTTKDSINGAWKNASFRGYVDYMQTPEFKSGIERLVDIAQTQPTAIMCAEAVPWRCHRSLIGDVLLVRKIKVMDIMNHKTANPHKMTAFAKVKGQTIAYPQPNK